MLTHGSLFSGIGGFDLAAEWMNWTNLFHCEFEPWNQKILKYYWPNAKTYKDIRKTDFSFWRGKIDILSGGFPCQPFSSAGKRKGTEDERHLWPEMLRAIREIKPRWIVGENVSGLVNWSGGLVFEEVQSDLEAQGYQVRAFILPAAGVNAPHKRDRVWFVAYSDKNSNFREPGENEREGRKERIPKRHKIREFMEPNCFWGDVADSNEIRLQRGLSSRSYEVQRWNKQRRKISKYLLQTRDRLQFQNFPTQPPICGGDDGVSYGLDNITFSKWRNESLKAYGNAIVPQVAYQIFLSIRDYENLK